MERRKERERERERQIRFVHRLTDSGLGKNGKKFGSKLGSRQRDN